MLEQSLVETTEKLLKKNRKLIARLVWERSRFEGWLQLEILNSLMGELPKLEIERSFPLSQERCDFWIQETRKKESWLELKLCVTNYCSEFADSHKSRPITTQVSDIVRDAEKLARIAPIHRRSVLILAYPLPEDYSQHFAWIEHLSRIQSAGKKLDEAFTFILKRNSQTSNLVGYVLRV